jgi:phosphoribosyl-ATP pyrophosphohydrolase
MHGAGVSDDSKFLPHGLSQIRELMLDDGLEFIYTRFVAPTTATIHFSKSLNRSIIGSMNDLVYHAKIWLTEGELSPHDVSFKLNEMPMSAVAYANPREALKSLNTTQISGV